MKLKIIQVGNPVLRQVARELSREEILSPAISQLIYLMQETMRDAPGVGLAAPQIGEAIRLIVIEDRAEYSQCLSQEQLIARERKPVPFHVIVNPTLTIQDATLMEFHEGCLSLSGFKACTPRALAVTVAGLNEKAQPILINARGWYARILQHEVDHLNGCLYIDRMNSKSFTDIENYNRYSK